MNSRFGRYSLSFFLTLTLAACAESRIFGDDEFDKPTKLTIQQALESIAYGYKGMKEILGDEKIGLFACKTIVTLNVTATGDSKDGLVLNASARPAPGWEKLLVTGEVGAKGDFSTAFTANRNNTITFEMYNAACIPTGTLGFDKPDKVAGMGKTIIDWTSMAPVMGTLTPEQQKHFQDLLNQLNKPSDGPGS